MLTFRCPGSYMSIRFVSALLHAAKNIETAIITCPIEDGHDDGDDGDDGDGARRMFEERFLWDRVFVNGIYPLVNIQKAMENGQL